MSLAIVSSDYVIWVLNGGIVHDSRCHDLDLVELFYEIPCFVFVVYSLLKLRV